MDSVVKAVDSVGGLGPGSGQLWHKDAVGSGEEGPVVRDRSGVWVSVLGSRSEGWRLRSSPHWSADARVLSQHRKRADECGRPFLKRGLSPSGHLEGDSVCVFLG